MNVGIIGGKSGNNFGIGQTYYNFIEGLGGTPVIITPIMSGKKVESLIESLSLLILPGGADLSSYLYKARPSIHNSNPDLMKEYFFITHLDKFIEARVPVFGICLGFQMLNVKFGGTLTQHVNPSVHQEERRYYGAHNVIGIDGLPDMEVNSHHHQAVKHRNLGNGLMPEYFSHEYAKKPNVKDMKESSNVIIESFIHESLPVAGVQWHPEEWFDDYSSSLINRIISKR